jgi:spoIIIJ-associated protein
MEDPILKIIHTFIEKLGVSIDAVEEVPLAAHRMYNLKTNDSKRLIGPQGDHLQALNLILRRYCERIPEIKDIKFILDVNGYQMVRIRDIEAKARILADRVRTLRSSAELTPMNAYERMIIHALFAQDPDVLSVSEGTGKVRHVVLRYRGV